MVQKVIFTAGLILGSMGFGQLVTAETSCAVLRSSRMVMKLRFAGYATSTIVGGGAEVEGRFGVDGWNSEGGFDQAKILAIASGLEIPVDQARGCAYDHVARGEFFLNHSGYVELQPFCGANKLLVNGRPIVPHNPNGGTSPDDESYRVSVNLSHSHRISLPFQYSKASGQSIDLTLVCTFAR